MGMTRLYLSATVCVVVVAFRVIFSGSLPSTRPDRKESC